MSAKRSDERRFWKYGAGYLLGLVGVVAVSPLVLQADKLVGMEYAAFIYLVVTLVVQYYFGIAPALFTICLVLCATSLLLTEPKGVIWPIFKVDDQLHLAMLAMLAMFSTGAVNLIRKYTVESSRLAIRTAELATATAALENDLQRRVRENDELKAELHKLTAQLADLSGCYQEVKGGYVEAAAGIDLLQSLAESIAWFPLGTACERVLDRLIAHLNADLGSVWTYSGEGSSISLIAQKGYTEGLLRPREILYIPYDGLLHKILGSGSPFCGVPDSSGPFLRLTYASGVKSLAVVPLRYEDAITGFLSVGSKVEHGFEPDLRLLQTTANLLALSMKIAQQKINLEIWREVA